MLTSRTHTRIQFIGYPKSGKKNFLELIQVNELIHQPIKLFFRQNTFCSTILPNDDINEIIKKCDLDFNVAKDPRHWVFCIDPLMDAKAQFASIAIILDYLQKSKNILVPYSLLITKMDMLNGPETQDKFTRLLKEVSPDLPLPLQTMYCGAFNSREHVKGYVTNILRISRTEFTIARTAAGIHNPTTLDQVMDKFHKEFKELDEMCFDNGVSAQKQKIYNLVRDTLRELQLYNSDEKPISDRLQTIFAKVFDSHVLAMHQNPKRDKALGIKILGTQQKLLGMIRTEALDDLRRNFTKIENRAEVHNEDIEFLVDEINRAKKMPLFNMHRSNIPSFLRPNTTEAVSELELLEKDYSQHLLNQQSDVQQSP